MSKPHCYDYANHPDPAGCPCRELEAQARELVAVAGLSVSPELLDIDRHMPRVVPRFQAVFMKLDAARELLALGWADAAFQALEVVTTELRVVRDQIARDAWARIVEMDRAEVEAGKPLSAAQADVLRHLPGGAEVYALAVSKGLVPGEAAAAAGAA